MGYSLIKTIEASQQACELQVGYVYLRSCVAEIQDVIQGLGEMSSFQADIQRLSRIREKLSNQSGTLRLMSRTLDDIVELYQACEKKNLRELDGSVWTDHRISLFASGVSPDEARFTVLSQPMVPSRIVAMLTQAAPAEGRET